VQSTKDLPGDVDQLHTFHEVSKEPLHTTGVVDYSVWVMAHAPIWGQYQAAMLESAQANIRARLARAKLDQSDWDRKRWAGGLFASTVRGPWILATLRMKKQEGNYIW
jgi:hypothetical protein